MIELLKTPQANPRMYLLILVLLFLLLLGNFQHVQKGFSKLSIDLNTYIHSQIVDITGKILQLFRVIA